MAEAEPSTIARPYARAAFSHALGRPDGLDAWLAMLRLLAAAVEQPRVREVLDNPQLTTDDKAALLQQLMGDSLSEDGRNLVEILAEYGRLALIPRIFEVFELLKANHEKTMQVKIVSAFEVSDQEKAVLSSALQRKLQRNISIEAAVDKSLIGGVVIKAEDTVIDDSVLGKLERLSRMLN